MHIKHFTIEQLEEIRKYIKAVESGSTKPQGTFKVKDGYVSLGDDVWWECEDGPERVKVEHHLINIEDFPEIYSIEKPKYKIVYE